jgi:hypothetical protein
MPPPPLWTFETPPAPRAPHVLLVAFSHGPLADDVPLSLSRFGIPSAEHAQALDVRTVTMRDDAAWIDGWRRDALRVIAAADLGDALRMLDEADHAHVIVAAPESPQDLGYLQAAWGMARHVAARGATVVLDVHAATFRTASALPPADAQLDPRLELRIVYETDSTRPDHAHALHTRGMRKFGAPDIVALCGDADARLVGDVVGQVAAMVARGGDLASPRHGIDLDANTTWYAVDDEHGLADLLQLNNQARVLVDEQGHHLTGVLRRLRARHGMS